MTCISSYTHLITPATKYKNVFWYSGKIRFIEKPGEHDEGGRHVAKRSSDPRVAYPEVNVQVRDLVRVVGTVAPFAPRGFSIRGKFVLSIGSQK